MSDHVQTSSDRDYLLGRIVWSANRVSGSGSAGTLPMSEDEMKAAAERAKKKPPLGFVPPAKKRKPRKR